MVTFLRKKGGASEPSTVAKSELGRGTTPASACEDDPYEFNIGLTGDNALIISKLLPHLVCY